MNAMVDLSSALRAGSLIAAMLLFGVNTAFAAPPSDSIFTQIFAKKKLTVKNIYATAEQQAWLSEAGISLKRYAGKPADQAMMNGVLKKFVAYNENNGYPFARAQLDSIQLDSVFFSATLKLEKGSCISIDTLVVKGDGRVRPRFMQNHLALRKPRLYSERYVQSVDRRIDELGFLSAPQPSALDFGAQSAALYIFVDNAKANRANGLLAFGADESGELQLQGEASIFVANMFKGGEELAVDWRSPDKNVQMLNVGAKLPYIILGAIGVSAAFDMERRDTLYLSLHSKVGLLSRAGSCSTASLFVDAQQHSNTTANIQTSSVLYGADYTLRNVDNPLFPRSGVHASVSVAAGTRKAESNQSTEVESMASVACYAAATRRTSLMLRAQGKIKGVFGNGEAAALYQSELYSIGGANSLRGFNERSLFTSAYAIAALEPQFYFSARGYLSAFCDYALAKNERDFSQPADQFLSFGVGTRFATEAGIFSLSYALGKATSGSFLLKNAKVHVSYMVVF